jgi:predicted TIM-barrel fold metal-dependent hydrolase
MRIDSHVHIGIDLLFYLKGWSPYCLDIPRLMLESEGTGIDAFIVFPFISYIGMDIEKLRKNQVEISLGEGTIPYQFENWRLYNEIKRYPLALQQRFWPFLIGDSGRKPMEQVQEWNKLPQEYKIYGIKIQPTIVQSPILSLLGEGSCMLDYAEQHNIPILIHSSIHPDDRWAQCSDILHVVESRPTVRFALAHSCCFHAETLKRISELPNAWFDTSAHIIRCQCAVGDFPAVATRKDRFDTDYLSPERVLLDLAEAYPDKTIWGSDAPFYTCEHDKLQLRSAYRREVDCLNSLPQELSDRICSKNTLTWLGGR